MDVTVKDRLSGILADVNAYIETADGRIPRNKLLANVLYQALALGGRP
jgi:hypothetical protein